MNKNLLIIGCGGHGRVVLDAALKMNVWNNIAFVDDTYPKVRNINSIKVLSKIKNINKLNKNWKYIIIAIGDNFIREKIKIFINNYNFSFANIIDPSVSISAHAKIGKGNVILANSILATGSIIKNNSIINHGAIIDHDCFIGSNTHICSEVTMSGNVKIGNNVFIGLSTSIINGVHIGNNVKIGAHSLINKSIISNKLAYGIPAKINDK